MNHSAELSSSSVHSTTPRFQQPRIPVSPPPENAAAGDAPRSQISSELNLDFGSSAEMITMDTSRSSISQLWNLLNDPMEIVISTTDKENSSNNRSDLENRRALNNRSTNERTTVDKILSPDRKVSMFSAEIWTEKVLPSHAIVYPEPELVEIYFDKETTSDRFNRFGGYSTESIEVPSIWTGSNRGPLGTTNPMSPPLSGRKSRTSSSGQKTINFDDEIWPVCPMLIPSERELSQCNLGNKYDSISPEKLDENVEEKIAITHPGSKLASAKDSSILGTSSSSSSKQNEPKNSFKDRKLIEPTHEIEYQNSCENSPEKLEKFYNLERISCEIKSVTSTARPTEPSAGITDQKFEEEGKEKLVDRFTIDYEPCQSRHSRSNLLSVSNGEPVNAILEDIRNEKEKLSNLIFNENEASPGMKQTSFASIKNCEVDYGVFKERTTSRDTVDTSRSSVINSKNVTFTSKNKFISSEDGVNPSDSTTDSEFRFMESSNAEESVIERKIKKNRKSVKIVRFETCDENGDIKIDERIPKEAKNFQTNYVRQDRSKIRLILDDRSETADFPSVENFQQEVDHLANKISRQIEMDPLLDDALETLTKVERIVEGNRQIEERLQQLQPNVTIPWSTPSDAGKLLAKALMRCRNYMLNNGYNRGATITINKLLASKVQNLKQLVERQRLTLATQEKRRSAPSGRRQSTRSRHDNFPNSKGALIMNEIGTNQVKLLIGDILTSTEKLLHKLTVNKSQKKSSGNTSKNSIKNNRTSSDAVHSKTNKTNSPKEFNIRSEIRGSKASVRDDELIVSRGRHEELVREFENSHPFVPSATYLRKPSPNEPTKTLKKLFNDLWENRSKTLPRHYNVNDSTTNNFRSLASPHNNSISQKVRVWKPAGHNVVQSSVNIIPNNQKIRSLPSSSASKRKNFTNEQTRETKSQQRTKTTSATVKDPLKIVEKSVTKSHDATSFAKVHKDQMKGHQSEVTSLDKRKVQVLGEVVETKARKPRSKSRTRTRSPIKMPRVTVTEIPLKQAKEYSPTIEQKVAPAEGVPPSKKPSLYPKGIIQMLEDLIRSSSHETSIRNGSSVQIVARCNVAAEEDVSNFLPLKSKVRAITETELHSSHNQDHYGTEVLSDNESNQLKFAKELTVSETTAEVIDDITDRYNLRKDFDLSSEENAARILATSRSNSEVSENQRIEKLNTFSVTSAGCKAESSSEHSIGCISSKYCQASLTSVTSREISEEIDFSQVSDTAVSSDYCEKTPKESNESFDTVEYEEVTRDECVQRFQRDQSVSTENGVTPKKKFANRHAKSLEMLKEILSDQGLGIHFLSRAESEMKGRRCKCSSSKKGSMGKRSSGVSCCGETVSKTSLPDGIFSSTLFSKLATLSESESDIEQVEVATMTSENGSAGNINDHKISSKFQPHCNKSDKNLLNGIVTIENATQFDIPLKSDVCVGDELVSDTLLPLNTKNEHILADNSEVVYTLPDTFYPMSFNHEEKVIGENETFECKLPKQILEAFRLAAVRANNLNIAFRILREGMPCGIIRDSNRISTDGSTPSSESVVADQHLFDLSNMKPAHVESLAETFRPYSDEKLFKQLDDSKCDPPLKIIVPRIRKNIDDERDELCTEKSQVRSIETCNRIIAKESRKKFSNPDKVNPPKPRVRPKQFEISNRKSSVVKINGKTVLKERNVDSNYMTSSENKLGLCTRTPRGIATVRIKDDRLRSQREESLISGSGNEKQIKMLHFAGKQVPSVVGNTSGIIDVANNSQSLNANSSNRGSSETGRRIEESLPGSRIKTLLEENLQRFRIDYSPMDDDLIFKDFRDQRFADSTDDEAVINEAFIETATSTSRTHLADCNILSEVKSVLNFLLNRLTDNSKSPTITDYRDICPHLPRHRERVRKPIRRTKTDRERKIVEYGNRSLLCGKYFSFSGGLIVSREHLLSLIYAAVCSFVFFCLQFSVHCEI